MQLKLVELHQGLSPPRVDFPFHRPVVAGAANGRSLVSTAPPYLVDAPADLLDQAMGLLDGTRSVDQILGELLVRGFEIETVLDLLQRLAAAGVLAESDGSPLARLPVDERERFGPQMRSLAVLAGSPERDLTPWSAAGVECQVALREGVVALSGATDDLVRLLELAGVGRVVTLDEDADVTVVVEGEFDLVVHDTRAPAAIEANNLNAAALAGRVPVLFHGRTPLAVELGPLVVPYETACLECYKRRRAGAQDTGEPRTGEWTGELAFPVGIEMVKFVSGAIEPITRGRMWRLDLLSGIPDVHPVLRLPRCPSCGPAPDRPRRRLWQGL